MSKTRKIRKKSFKNHEFKEHLKIYDVLDELAKALSGLLIVKLWKEEVMKAQKDLRRVLDGMKINKVVKVTAGNASNQNWIRKLCPVQIYGLNV